MYSKHLILVTAVLLSATACSSPDDSEGGEGGSGVPGSGGTQAGNGGSTGTGTGGTTVTSGAGGSTVTSGAGGLSSSKGGTAGTASPGAGGTSAGGSAGTGTGGTAGTSAGGHAGTSAGGVTGTAGTGSGGTGGTGVVTGTGGSGPGTAVKCDNLALAPSTTGVAKPAGAAGGLKVIDWAGFKGAASFTFDDNTPSQLPNYNALKATGGRVTWFLIGASAGTGYKAPSPMAKRSPTIPRPTGALPRAT